MNLTVELTNKLNWNELIAECFSSDSNYIKYHWAADTGLDNCIKITEKELGQATNYSLFKIKNEDNQIIGMFGIEKQSILNPFFIKPKFRKKEYIEQVMKKIKDNLKKEWYIGLYSQNTPIVSFFEKNNGIIIQEGIWNNKEVKIYKFNNGNL